MITSAVPARTCSRCGEYLPHWCAPVVTVRYGGGRARRRVVTITDRQPPP